MNLKRTYVIESIKVASNGFIITDTDVLYILDNYSENVRNLSKAFIMLVRDNKSMQDICKVYSASENILYGLIKSELDEIIDWIQMYEMTVKKIMASYRNRIGMRFLLQLFKVNQRYFRTPLQLFQYISLVKPSTVSTGAWKKLLEMLNKEDVDLVNSNEDWGQLYHEMFKCYAEHLSMNMQTDDSRAVHLRKIKANTKMLRVISNVKLFVLDLIP